MFAAETPGNHVIDGSGSHIAWPDGVFDRTRNRLEDIPVFGKFVKCGHWWSSKFSATLVYGELYVDNMHNQSADSLNTTRYATTNIVWIPTERWLVGADALWDKREDLNGANESDFRTQSTSRFMF